MFSELLLNHVMPIEWEEAIPEIVKRAGLLPRPRP